MQQSGFDEKRFGKYRKKNQKKNYVKGKNEIKCIKPVNLFAKHYSHALNSVNQTIATIFVWPTATVCDFKLYIVMDKDTNVNSINKPCCLLLYTSIYWVFFDNAKAIGESSWLYRKKIPIRIHLVEREKKNTTENWVFFHQII